MSEYATKSEVEMAMKTIEAVALGKIKSLESELARVKAELEKHGVCKLIEQERDNLKETLKKMKLAEKTIDFLQDNDGPYIEELQKDRDAWKLKCSEIDASAAKQNAHMNDLLGAERRKAERYEAALKEIGQRCNTFSDGILAHNLAKEALKEFDK